MMHIAYFCQYFVPETAAPAARVSELAQVWAEAGHRVTVVTGFPNHPTGQVPDRYKGMWFARERLGRLDVWRNWLYATPNEGFVRKTNTGRVGVHVGEPFTEGSTDRSERELHELVPIHHDRGGQGG